MTAPLKGSQCSTLFVGGGVLDAPQVCVVNRFDIGAHSRRFVGRGLDPSTGQYRKARPGRRGRRPLQITQKSNLGPEGVNLEKDTKALRKMQSFLHFLAFGFFDHTFGVLRGE